MKRFCLEDICFKKVIGDISPKLKVFSYLATITERYSHTKFTKVDVFTSVYDIGIPVDI